MADKIKIGSSSGASYVAQINPESVKIRKKISYETLQAMGSNEYLNRYKHHEPSSLSFDIYMDDTGAVPNSDHSNIQQRIISLENAIYNMKDNLKEPGYVILAWGSVVFHGRADSIDYDYTLFAADGTPLRVKIALSFVGTFENSSAQSSGGVTTASTVTFSSGDTLADYCDKIYGDASYCTDVAKANGLASIRNVLPGTAVYFPPTTRKIS